ncbi:MAG: permease of major facilitator superfamily [Deltaproteobacteria bacterium]|jgi:hypothetical protein|nr:permease of major facilitator superfamily [Deltaproteobacteria bacterium]
MKKPPTEIVIPKEAAVFFLDGHGVWRHKEQGKFEHRKIINYFHSCIRRDENGYHLRQRLGDRVEKVYFHYEDTALFVFDVIKGEDISLVLNTQKKIRLRPKKLFVNDDNLYVNSGEHRIKFTDNSLIRIWDLLGYEGDDYFITVKGRRYKIRQLKEEAD